jgi:hypothetical protein
VRRTFKIGVAGILLALIAGCAVNARTTGTNSSSTISTSRPTVTTTPVVKEPTVTMVCPRSASGNWTWYDAKFGYSIQPGSAPITGFAIDYGDGRKFTNSSVDQVFEHRYTTSGTFKVVAAVLDGNGKIASGSCTWTLNMFSSWSGSGGTPNFGGSLCRDGTWSSSTGRGTCSWHGGIAR